MAGTDPGANVTFRPFPIWVAGTAGAAVAAVAGAPAGDLAQTRLNLDALEPVRTWLPQVRAGALDPGTVAAVGRGLYAILFTPALHDLYQQSRGVVAAQGQRLRVLLRVDVPELAVLPWELLCDPQATGPSGGFLALDPQVSLVRYLPQALRPVPPPRQGPLRVLAVFAGPRDQAPLDLGRELRLVTAALGRIDPAQIRLDLLAGPALLAAAGLGPALGPPTPDALRAALDAGYEVLHYAGHGLLRPGGDGFLALEDAAGNTALFDAPRLALAVNGSPLRLAVLAACDTAAAAAGPAPSGVPGREALVESSDVPPAPVAAPLAVAPALIGAGLGAVVAMQFRIPDASAVTFSQALYTALSRNDPIDAAVSGARKALRLEIGNPQADWAIPVLFVQEVGDGRLWQPPAPSGAEAPAPPLPERPAPDRPGIQTGNINTGGGAVALGGNVFDNRVTHTRHGGIDFAGPTTISGPVVGGDVQSLTVGGPPGPAAAIPGPVDFSGAFAALVAEIDDDTLLAQANTLRAELLAPRPRWAQLRALRTAFEQAGLQAAITTFFADPTVRPLVTAAKVRSLDAGATG